ncbi:MAG: DMT family transporter [Pseudomonadota bacterium]
MAPQSQPAVEQKSNALAYLLLTLTALSWGCNAIFGKLAVGEISPMVLVSLRWLLSLAFLLSVAGPQLKRDWPLLRTRLPFLSVMGMLGFTGFNALFYSAAHLTTAVNIGILQGSIPVIVLIGVFLLHRTPVTVYQIIGVLVTLVGVVTVVFEGDIARIATMAINRGDLLMLLACALYAGYTIGLSNRPQVGALSLFTVMAASAFAVSLPLAGLEYAFGDFQAPTTTGWILVGLIALLPSFLAQIFYIKGVELIGPGRAGVFVNLVPVFAAILSVAYLGEAFKTYHAIALALVLGGIWLSERRKA